MRETERERGGGEKEKPCESGIRVNQREINATTNRNRSSSGFSPIFPSFITRTVPRINKPTYFISFPILVKRVSLCITRSSVFHERKVNNSLPCLS